MVSVGGPGGRQQRLGGERVAVRHPGDLPGVAAGAEVLPAVLPGRDHGTAQALEPAFRFMGAHPAAAPTPPRPGSMTRPRSAG